MQVTELEMFCYVNKEFVKILNAEVKMTVLDLQLMCLTLETVYSCLK